MNFGNSDFSTSWRVYTDCLCNKFKSIWTIKRAPTFVAYRGFYIYWLMCKILHFDIPESGHLWQQKILSIDSYLLYLIEFLFLCINTNDWRRWLSILLCCSSTLMFGCFLFGGFVITLINMAVLFGNSQVSQKATFWNKLQSLCIGPLYTAHEPPLQHRMMASIAGTLTLRLDWMSAVCGFHFISFHFVFIHPIDQYIDIGYVKSQKQSV
jgi:hypothetical protein